MSNSWEDVVDALMDEMMLDTSTPGEETLRRWQERYPEYSPELARFFGTWSAQMAGAMQMLEERGLILKPFPIEPLRPFDHIILSAVHELQGEGYAVNIAEKASGMLGSEVLLGDTFGSLERLEHQGLVMARMSGANASPAGRSDQSMGDPEECEGGARRYFAATLSGERTLAEAPAPAKAVTGLLGDTA
jgi:hypothetical protein